MFAFQSTLPAREATGKTATQDAAIIISIHASRGGSDMASTVVTGRHCDFNPRFPRGKRHLLRPSQHGGKKFQSTLLAREATSVGVIDSDYYGFQSTLPAGEATRQRRRKLRWQYFNPRFPRGKRHSQKFFVVIHRYFNPRFPRRKRHSDRAAQFEVAISIHASRGGSDSSPFNIKSVLTLFQSTLPAGEATHLLINFIKGKIISIHASHGGKRQ